MTETGIYKCTKFDNHPYCREYNNRDGTEEKLPLFRYMAKETEDLPKLFEQDKKYFLDKKILLSTFTTH